MIPILIFGEDWGRHNSGCQRITSELLRQGHDITWVNTIGTRRPRIDRYTVRRGLGKLKQWCRHRQQLSSELAPVILSPLMWPSLHFPVERRLNSFVINAQIRKHITRLSEPPIIVSKVPLPLELVDRLPARRWVYYCVDHIAEWPGSDHTALAEMESNFIERADRIIVTSRELQERLQRLGRQPVLLKHGVDLDLWQRPTDFQLPEYERPLIVFWGLIDRRIDQEIVRHLSENLDAGTILLLGPQQMPPPGLLRIPHVAHHPAVDYVHLPSVGKSADVLIMPYCRNELTRFMQPVKLTEYMATGKPVVVTSIPATEEWRDSIFVAEHKEQFLMHVRQALECGLPDSHRKARQRLKQESWSAKAMEFLEILGD